MSYTPDDIRSLRKRLKLSQLGLASEIGVARSNVSRWENGETKPSGSAQKLLQHLVEKSSEGATA